MKSKVMTASQAVAEHINDGDTVYIGGFAASISYALVHEIIRQGKKDLTIVTASFNEHADQMVGAGCVARVQTSYFWMEVYGHCHCYRRAVERGIPRPIEVEDYTNFTMTLRLWAGAVGVPFVPTNSIKGSDIARYSSFMGEGKVKIIEDPFGSGVEYALVPALKPDVAIIHGHRADERGNVQFWGQLGDIPWGANASRKVIASVEEIVDHDVITHDPNRTYVPEFKVVAVVPEPWGSHPKPVQGYYDVDKDFIFNYIEMSRREDTWKQWMDKWVYGVKDRSEYVEKYIAEYGWKKFSQLRARSYPSSAVNYGF